VTGVGGVMIKAADAGMVRFDPVTGRDVPGLLPYEEALVETKVGGYIHIRYQHLSYLGRLGQWYWCSIDGTASASHAGRELAPFMRKIVTALLSLGVKVGGLREG